jgi:quercetin dioxygenase-like cupin family protein
VWAQDPVQVSPDYKAEIENNLGSRLASEARPAWKNADAPASCRPLEAVVIELKPRPADYKAAPIALDPVKLDPPHHLVPLENDRVRVLRTILEPHLKSPMHEHPHYVVVYLTELHTTMTLGDGRTVDNPRRPGEIAWRDALQHVTENIGDHTAMEIQVELK